MAIADVFDRIVSFLRAEHPGDRAGLGYSPLLALLPRRLSEDDVLTVAADLGSRAWIEKIDIRVAVTKITGELATDADTARVEQLLLARGFPVG